MAEEVPQVLGVTTSNFYPYPSGSLINDSGTVYVISGTRKIPFTSSQAFVGLGYSWKNVIDGDLTNYTLSTSYVLSTPNMEHPWGSWLISKGTVYYYTQDGLIGVPSGEVFTNNGGAWNLIVRANKYDLVHLSNSLSILTDNDSRVFNAANTTNNSQIPNGLSFGTPQANTNTNQQTNQNQTAATTTNQTNLQNPTTPQISIPYSVTANTGIVFSATATDPNGLPLSYIFTWGDGSTPTTVSTNSATHTYSTPGSYSLMVTVTDTAGKTNSNSVMVSVVTAQTQQQTNQANQNQNNGSIVTIYAAGTSAAGVFPTMQLLVNNQVVQTFNDVEGDPNNAVYKTFTYNSPVKVSINQVKIAFTNDYATSFTDDRNLRVHDVNIDGTDYLTTDASVYGVGIRYNGVNCENGNYQSEWLNCYGYFQFGLPVSAQISSDPAAQARDTQRLADMQTIINALEAYKTIS